MCKNSALVLSFMITLYNVCLVHGGNFLSTSGGVKYIGGYHDSCGDIMSASGDVQYIRGDIMSTSGISRYMWGYHEYIRGCSVHWGTMSTSRGYHEYIRGCSVQWGFQQKLEGFYQLALPHAS